jgi:uncharacterized protein (TIGR00369 family)
MRDQPSDFGDYVGIDGYDVVGDKVVVKLRLEGKHMNRLGLAHGGAIATLMDNSMGLACQVKAGRPLVTVEFKMSFVRPARGGTLTATSHVDKMGKHLTFVGCDVTDEGGLLVAKALGTYTLVD